MPDKIDKKEGQEYSTRTVFKMQNIIKNFMLEDCMHEK